MSITLKILLSAAILLSGVAMASAATRHDKNVIRQRNQHVQASAAPASGFSDRDSPAATGGGSLGYNQNIYRF